MRYREDCSNGASLVYGQLLKYNQKQRRPFALQTDHVKQVWEKIFSNLDISNAVWTVHL